MAILRIASVIALLVHFQVNSWTEIQKLTKAPIVKYNVRDKPTLVERGLENIYGKRFSSNQLSILFEDKDFFHVDLVNITCS